MGAPVRFCCFRSWASILTAGALRRCQASRFRNVRRTRRRRRATWFGSFHQEAALGNDASDAPSAGHRRAGRKRPVEHILFRGTSGSEVFGRSAFSPFKYEFMRKRRRSAAEMYQVVDQHLQGQLTTVALCSMQLPISVERPLPAAIPFLRA